jgi:hypothetical protein
MIMERKERPEGNKSRGISISTTNHIRQIFSGRSLFSRSDALLYLDSVSEKRRRES